MKIKTSNIPRYTRRLNYDEYSCYLESEKWAKIRSKRLLMDNYECQICKNRSNLQVHHLIYPPHGEFGTESINDIITLCEFCHKMIDDLRKGQRFELKKTYSSCIIAWLRFQDLQEYEEADIDEISCANSGGIELIAYFQAEHKTKFLGYINISTITVLRNNFGQENIMISIKQ